MEWKLEVLNAASHEDAIQIVLQLVESLGFKEAERVETEEWKIDLIALREDPISGLEKYAIRIKINGLASSKEVEEFGKAITKAKADKGIFLSINGFTKDAKVLLGREYRGRIIPWDGEKL
ncbi:MAG TPA: restriction endonuclease, partial [Thermococcus litoralis]|nr:restriction endonuclease [Thermococcus litoralis]